MTNFKSFNLKTVFFELLHAKPCRTIMKLPQKVSFGPETCEIEPKLWFLASGFCLLRLGEPSSGSWGNPGGPPSVTAFKKLYKTPLGIPLDISRGFLHSNLKGCDRRRPPGFLRNRPEGSPSLRRQKPVARNQSFCPISHISGPKWTF